MKNKQTENKAQRGERGQSLVEMTLIVMILLLLVVIAADLGWTFFTMVSLRDAAQEGSIAGSVCPGAANHDRIRDRVRDSTTHPGDVDTLLDSEIDICYIDVVNDPATCDPNYVPSAGDKITVTIHYTHQLFTPLLSAFVGGPSYQLDVDSTSTILTTTCTFAP